MDKQLKRSILISGILHITLVITLGVVEDLVFDEKYKKNYRGSSPERVKERPREHTVEIVSGKGERKRSKKNKDECASYYGGIGIHDGSIFGRVEAVYPGYPAERNDVRVGDFIENNHELRGPTGESVTVRIRRNGELIIKTITREKICLEELKT